MLIFNLPTLTNIHSAIKQLLLASSSFKIKSKILIFVKSMIQLASTINSKSTHQLFTAKIFLIKIVFDIMRAFISGYKDSKLHYYSLLNIGLALQQVS